MAALGPRSRGGPGCKETGSELKDGDTAQTVQTGTTDGRRKSRKASKELAESLNEAGSGFKWDLACEGQIFLC